MYTLVSAPTVAAESIPFDKRLGSEQEIIPWTTPKAESHPNAPIKAHTMARTERREPGLLVLHAPAPPGGDTPPFPAPAIARTPDRLVNARGTAHLQEPCPAGLAILDPCSARATLGLHAGFEGSCVNAAGVTTPQTAPENPQIHPKNSGLEV